MTLDEALEDALQWLKDCGGTMAMSNNPMANQLINAGFAKKGGFNHLGQRTLVLIKTAETSTSSLPSGISFPTYNWFNSDPIPDADDHTVNSHLMSVFHSIKAARAMQPRKLPPVPEAITQHAPFVRGFMLFSTNEAERFDRYITDLTSSVVRWVPESRIRHRGLGIKGVLRIGGQRYVCLRMPPIPNGSVVITDDQVQEKLLLRFN